MSERVAEPNELADGDRKSIIVDDTPALLLRVGETYYCIEDVCTHDGQPLTDGPLEKTDAGCSIECPRHGARFDLSTGAPLCMPATEPIRTFSVEQRETGVYVSPEE